MTTLYPLYLEPQPLQNSNGLCFRQLLHTAHNHAHKHWARDGCKACQCQCQLARLIERFSVYSCRSKMTSAGDLFEDSIFLHDSIVAIISPKISGLYILASVLLRLRSRSGFIEHHTSALNKQQLMTRRGERALNSRVCLITRVYNIRPRQWPSKNLLRNKM